MIGLSRERGDRLRSHFSSSVCQDDLDDCMYTCDDCHVALGYTPAAKIDETVVQIRRIQIDFREEDGQANEGNYRHAVRLCQNEEVDQAITFWAVGNDLQAAKHE